MNTYIFTAEDIEGEKFNSYMVKAATEEEACRIFIRNTMPLIDEIGFDKFVNLIDYFKNIDVKIVIFNFDSIQVLS